MTQSPEEIRAAFDLAQALAKIAATLPVTRIRGTSFYACHAIRAEVTRRSSKTWGFRVWHVLGDRTLATEFRPSNKRTAVANALTLLTNFAAADRQERAPTEGTEGETDG